MLLPSNEGARQPEPEVAQRLFAEETFELRRNDNRRKGIGAMQHAVKALNARELRGKRAHAALESGKPEDERINARLGTNRPRHRGVRLCVGNAQDDEEIDVRHVFPRIAAHRAAVKAAGVEILAQLCAQRFDSALRKRGNVHVHGIVTLRRSAASAARSGGGIPHDDTTVALVAGNGCIGTMPRLHAKMKRRCFVRALMGSAAAALSPRLRGAEPPPKRVAAIVTHYTHNSHADVIVGRLLETHTLDGKGPRPNLQLVSLFVDQFPKEDISRRLAAEHRFPICATIRDSLLLSGKELAVDGVLLIGEHGKYPDSDTGQIMYPRRRFMEESLAVFRETGRAVPIFCDKHLAWNWDDAKWMFDTARELRAPLMAGSSIPVTWRHPAVEMQLGAPAREAVGLSFGPLEGYGFHGLEALQCLAERRRGGESGVRAVQLLEGDAVWQAGEAGRFDLRVYAAAANAREAKTRFKGELREVLKPAAFFIEHLDGFRAVLLHDMGYANSEWVVAWSEEGREAHQATSFWTQEERPLGHFTPLVEGIEKMIHTGIPTWPPERTLLTTGILAAGFQSRKNGGARVETPHLAVPYQPTFTWTAPPPPPPGRPFTEK